MFIVYGTRGKELTGEYVPSIPCKHCGETRLSSRGVLRYFHIFWIPIFITARLFELGCSNCNYTIGKEDLSKEEAQRVKQTLFTPLRTIPYYTGLFLIALSALFFYLGNQEKKQNEAAMLNYPQVHDVYRIDLSKMYPDLEIDEYRYAAMKIAALENDGILFAISKVAYDKDSGLSRKIAKDFPEQDDYYEESGVLVPYEDIIELYNNGAIQGIHRFPEMSNERPMPTP